MRTTSARTRAALVTAAWAAALVGGLVVTVWLIRYYAVNGWLLADAHAYWLTGEDGYEPYQRAVGELDAYLYSPAFAQILSVITWLPWPFFAIVWFGLELAAFAWLLRPLGWRWGAVALLWCSPELLLGNVVGLLAVACVLALSGHPAAWSLPVLTKPTMAVGLVWHLVRREARQVTIALAACGAIVAVSFVFDPGAWLAWVRFLLDSSGDADGVVAVRILVSGAVMVFAASTSQSWLVPFALVLATPTIGSISVLSLLAAVPRLVGPDSAKEQVRYRGS